MKLRLTMMALLVASIAAFGCGESDDSGSAQADVSNSASPSGEGTSSQSADSDVASPESAEIAAAPSGLSDDGSLAGPPSENFASEAPPPSAGRESSAPLGDAAAAEPSFASEGQADSGEDSAIEEAEPPEEAMEEEVQWIQLSTDDSTSMASAQIYKSGQFLSSGLKVHEFINYYDPPHSLFAVEEFAETRSVDDSIRFGIKAHYVAAEIDEAIEPVVEDEASPEAEDAPEADENEGDENEGDEDDLIGTQEIPVETEDEPALEPIVAEEETVQGEFEVLFQMQSDAISQADRRNWNLFLCVDVSGSMRGEKMEFTIEALLKTLEHLKAGDRLTLTTFNSDAQNIFTDMEFGENEAEIRDAIRGLTPGGGTNMTAGLEQSYRLAQQNFDVDMLQRVILFGDGSANVGRTDLETFTSLTRINGSEGIYLSGVGVGNNYDFQRMDELTDAGKGAHIFLPNREEVDLIFGDYFHKLVEVAADGIEIEASLPTGIVLSGFSGEEVSFNPQQRLQNIVLATGDDMTFTAKFNVLDEAALDEPMSLKVTIRPLATDEEVVEIIEVDQIRDIIATPGRLFERTRLVHRFGTFATGGDEDFSALRDDLANYADPDWGIREIISLLDR